MTTPHLEHPQPALPAASDDPKDHWPFPDDLDDYERELEASVAAGEWRSVPDLEAWREWTRAVARATIATWSQERRDAAAEQYRKANQA